MFSLPDETGRPSDAPQKGEKPKQGKPKLQGKSPEKCPGATFGPFRIVPVRGQLDPGSKVAIQVEYNAQGDASHALNLALLVSSPWAFFSRNCVGVPRIKGCIGDPCVRKTC